METSRAKADFESEVKLISNVHHRNLVRLLGCASKGSECLLVYEYMANGSLDKFLFGMLLSSFFFMLFKFSVHLLDIWMIFLVHLIFPFDFTLLLLDTPIVICSLRGELLC